MSNPSYVDLVDSLVGMACQYLNGDSNLDDQYVSAGECCISSLTQLGLVKDNKIIPEAYDVDYLNNKFGGDAGIPTIAKEPS